MIKLQMTINSLALHRPVSVIVALPYTPVTDNGPYKTLWALHPAMEGGDFFFDKLSLASLPDQYNLAIVAPSLGNGYFINSTLEQQSDFLNGELLPYLQGVFPISADRQDNFLLGISMGAFGAVHWGFSNPHAFASVAALSGVYDPLGALDERVMKSRLLRPLAKLFREQVMGRLLLDADRNIIPEADILGLLNSNASSLPRLALFCGTEDYLSLNQTEEFAARCLEHHLDITTMYNSGTHDLRYWLDVVTDAIKWLFSCEA